MSVTVKRGKVIIRMGKHKCTIDAVAASKLGLKLLDAGKKAAKQAGQSP